MSARVLFACSFMCLCLAPVAQAAEFRTGVDMNYSLEMERAGKTWKVDGKPADVFTTLAKAGCDGFRVRLWVGDDGTNGLKEATETARRAQAAGMKPYLVIFLSDQWSDFVKQPRPAAWKDLDDAALLKTVEEYTERVVRHFSDAGIPLDTFEIGNEIDFGICGVFEEEWPKRMNLEYMRSRIWPRMAEIIVAAEKGVRKVRPDGKFMLHLTQWENADYCIAFWREMMARGVTVDLAGISYFPTAAAIEWHRTLDFLKTQVDTMGAAVERPLVICETGYPTLPNFGGQFGDWNKPVPGRNFDEAGQRVWLADLLRMARGSGRLAGVYYWSPEWAGSEIWGAFAMFDPEGAAREGLKGFAEAMAEKPDTEKKPATEERKSTWTGKPVFFGNLHSHTALSDGQGTPEEAFAHARDVAKLDFLAVTEHNHLLGGNAVPLENRETLYSGPAKIALVPAARKMSEDGKFIAIAGQEYSSMSQGNHVNVFDVPRVIPVRNGKFDELLPWLEANPDSTGAVPVVQLNHPGLGSPFPPFPGLRKKDFGRDDFGDEAGWVKRMGAVSYLIEVLNGEPPQGAADRRAPQMMEDYYRRFLGLGFHLAPTGNQDNHHREWGTATEVRTAVIADKLTLSSLLAAMRARHVYATEDRNLRLEIHVGGHDCGDIVSSGGALREQSITVRVEDTNEPDAEYIIEAFRGEIGGQLATVVKTFSLKGNTQEPVVVGNIDLERPGQFVYFRVTQKSQSGDDRTWTAPVWLEAAK